MSEHAWMYLKAVYLRDVEVWSDAENSNWRHRTNWAWFNREGVETHTALAPPLSLSYRMSNFVKVPNNGCLVILMVASSHTLPF